MMSVQGATALQQIKSQCSFSSKLEQTDIYRDRLPANSPYVGSFHRGHSVSDQQCPTYDVHEDRYLKSCPYIGSYNHSKRTPSAASADMKKHGHEASEDMRSQASTPQTAPTDSSMVVPGDLSQRHRSVSLGLCEDAPPEIAAPEPKRGQSKRKMYRHRSWADLTQFTKNKTPELCGLQAILPKECGVRILDKLGEGTFAKVVLALNKRNSGGWSNSGVYRKLMALPKEGEKLVLKCVRKEENSECEGLEECLQREVQLHSQCMHPNIPTMYGFYDDGKNVTMILDYIQGKELKAIISNERTVSADRAKLIMLQVLRALAHMHEKNFAHRDISPRNVLVSDEDKTFLIDLGLAVDLSTSPPTAHQNADGGPPGTMGYLSPEAMRGEGTSLKGDVWAVGCILYEMLFGFSPFLPHEVLTPEAVPFPDASWGMDCPADLEDLIKRMLDKDAQARCTAEEALAHACFGPEVKEKADALCAGDQLRREEERAACPSLDEQEAHWSFPPGSPGVRRMGSGLSGGAGVPSSPPSCLAVNLEIPKSLESTVGDHHNFLATVMFRGNSIDEEDWGGQE